jgi:hypothetical protein
MTQVIQQKLHLFSIPLPSAGTNSTRKHAIRRPPTDSFAELFNTMFRGIFYSDAVCLKVVSCCLNSFYVYACLNPSRRNGCAAKLQRSRIWIIDPSSIGQIMLTTDLIRNAYQVWYFGLSSAVRPTSNFHRTRFNSR